MRNLFGLVESAYKLSYYPTYQKKKKKLSYYPLANFDLHDHHLIVLID